MDEPPRTKREKPKKAASLTMRLTQRTRLALEEAAAAEGRSISEMAERWLDLAAQGQADLNGRLGGGAMAETMLTIAAFARLLAKDVAGMEPSLAGVDPTEDLGVRAALVGGAARLFALAYPIRGHGVSTPDPQPHRHALLRACAACRDDLNRVTAPAGAPNDLEAFGALDRCAVGDTTDRSLDVVAQALGRIAEFGDDGFKQTVLSVYAALVEYQGARERELDALARWTVLGRNLAEVIGSNALLERMQEQSRRAQSSMPGNPFGQGFVHQIAQFSSEAHFDLEQAVEDRVATS